MHALIRPLLAATLLALSAGAVLAQTPAPAAAAVQNAAPTRTDAVGPPAGFVAPAAPLPDETNAQRAKSQPGNNAPLWRAVRNSGNTEGISSLPGVEKGVLIQSFVQVPGMREATAGEVWRQLRNRWILPYGGAMFLILALALGLFYWRAGTMGGHVPDVGRKIERFTYVERASHWSVAISFVVLALSGLVIAFGKFLLLPIIGATLFGPLTYALKTAHNFAGPVFAVALAIFIVTFIRDNIPKRHDITWLLKAGGMFGGGEVPSHRFNAGEKLVFWGGVIALGLTVVGSGLVLDKLIPALDYTRGQMQVAAVIHAVASLLMMTMFLVHIYMGTIGMDGAYQGMKTGIVDEAWAKEHHALWFDDIQAGKIPAERTPGVLSAALPSALAPSRPQT